MKKSPYPVQVNHGPFDATLLVAGREQNKKLAATQPRTVLLFATLAHINLYQKPHGLE